MMGDLIVRLGMKTMPDRDCQEAAAILAEMREVLEEVRTNGEWIDRSGDEECWLIPTAVYEMVEETLRKFNSTDR